MQSCTSHCIRCHFTKPQFCHGDLLPFPARAEGLRLVLSRLVERLDGLLLGVSLGLLTVVSVEAYCQRVWR